MAEQLEKVLALVVAHHRVVLFEVDVEKWEYFLFEKKVEFRQHSSVRVDVGQGQQLQQLVSGDVLFESVAKLVACGFEFDDEKSQKFEEFLVIDEWHLQGLALELHHFEAKQILLVFAFHKEQLPEERLLFENFVDHFEVSLDDCLLGAATDVQELNVLWVEFAVLVAFAFLHDFVYYRLKERNIQLLTQTFFFLIENRKQSHLSHLGQSQVSIYNVDFVNYLLGVLWRTATEVFKEGEASLENILHFLGHFLASASLNEVEIFIEQLQHKQVKREIMEQ